MSAVTAFKKFRRETIVNGLVAQPIVPVGIRWKVISALGIKLDRSTIGPHVWFGGHSITIGEGSYISYRCSLDNSAPIAIGKRCDIGMDVSFVTSTHEIGPSERRAGTASGKPITVGDGAWIGARATILPGVTIGDGSIIAAGAVVTKDVKPNSLYKGVPAEWVRDLTP
jgi:maltose O-acetyltransferase